MSSLGEKFTVTPLHHFDWHLPAVLPIPLGHDLSIQNYKGRLPSVSHWNDYLSNHDCESVSQWSVCMEHRYSGTDGIQDDADETSRRFLATVTAVLRLVIPSATDGNHCLQLEKSQTGQLQPVSYFRPATEPILEDCEAHAPEFSANSFDLFKSWLDWIGDFAANGRAYLPLWISLNFSTLSYREHYKQIRHVLRVMALEALFSDENVYGLRAFTSRLLPLTRNWDLYELYRSEMQDLPTMLVNSKLLSDIVEMRNDIAHGAPIKDEWIAKRGRNGTYSLNYADELTEAVTALVRMVWTYMLTNNLQAVFADKAAMAKTFSARRD